MSTLATVVVVTNKINVLITALINKLETNQAMMTEMRRKITNLETNLLAAVEIKIKAMQEDVIAKIMGFLDKSKSQVEGQSTTKNISANCGVTVGVRVDQLMEISLGLH